MKKLVVILLLLGYGLSSFGMTLHIHYCCGKVDQVKLVPAKDHFCSNEGNKKKSCCDDTQVELKIKADYKNEVISWLKVKSITGVPVITNFSFYVAAISCNDDSVSWTHSPPFHITAPLYKKHCIYRI